MLERVHGRQNETKRGSNAARPEDAPVVDEKVPPMHAIHTDEVEAPKATDTRKLLDARPRRIVMYAMASLPNVCWLARTIYK